MPNNIDQLGVKAAGTVKAVKAGFNGLRGVFLHLAEEHGEVLSMMKRLRKVSNPQTCREHYAKVRAELLAHEHAEETEVYAALGRDEQTRELASLHHQQAAALQAAIGSIDAMEPGTEAWALGFERLLELVEQHVEEEEEQIFPKAQAALGEAASEALRIRYEAVKVSAEHQLA